MTARAPTMNPSSLHIVTVYIDAEEKSPYKYNIILKGVEITNMINAITVVFLTLNVLITNGQKI